MRAGWKIGPSVRGTTCIWYEVNVSTKSDDGIKNDRCGMLQPPNHPHDQGTGENGIRIMGD